MPRMFGGRMTGEAQPRVPHGRRHLRSRQRFGSADQVKDIAVEIGEEYETVPLILERFSEEFDAFRFQELMTFVEVFDVYGQMPDARIFHPIGRALTLRRDDLQQGAILGSHKVVAGIFEIDPKLEVLYVPLSERLWVRRCNGGVLQALEHYPGIVAGLINRKAKGLI